MAIAAVVLAGGVVAAVVLRDGGPGEGPVSPEAVGSCLVYAGAGDDRRVDRIVPCGEPHDARVLAFATGRDACPAGTDAVLATEADGDAAGPVLCVAEP